MIKFHYKTYYNPVNLTVDIVTEIPDTIFMAHKPYTTKVNDDGTVSFALEKIHYPVIKFSWSCSEELLLAGNFDVLYFAYHSQVENVLAGYKEMKPHHAKQLADLAAQGFAAHLKKANSFDNTFDYVYNNQPNPNFEWYSIGSTKNSTVLKNIDENSDQFRHKSRQLPGVENKVRYPCIHYSVANTIWGIIQHLNDVDKWSREKIADWLDDLHDKGEINIEFDVETISDKEIEEFVGGGES